MSRKREIMMMGIGVLTGLALLPAAKAGVTTLTATPSTQPIYVDGARVSMTAYAIGGSNYVKLRDVGAAVNFEVYWDGAAVQIESDKPYTGIAPTTQLGQGDGYLVNGKPITEENVMELLRQIETEYPQGTVWGTWTTPGTKKNETPSTVSGALMDSYDVNRVYGCSGYAAMVSSKLFGDTGNPCRRVTDLFQIRPGDIVFRVSNQDGHIWHVEVALESPDALRSFQVTGGNCGSAVWWPDEMSRYSKTVLACYGPSKDFHLEVWTRYSESVPFTGSSAGMWITEYKN